MNRIKIKEKARDLASNHLGDFWKAYIIVLAISFIGTFIITLCTAEEGMARSVANMVLSIVQLPLGVGFSLYTLNIVRDKKYDINDLFRNYKYFVPLLVTNIIMMLFVFLGCLLLIIPGIILSIAYTMAFFVFIDGEHEPMEALTKSMKMMKGYKADYFVFELSFLGWILLSLLTFGLLFIWVGPYYQFAVATYYDELKTLRSKESKAVETEDKKDLTKE